ncbi:thiamine pyrophosphate-binding protein [Pseudosulfitobacter koreensis]|uniref:Thiamine pyrophosphate-binding protein n=1 Tax=Pseudosulfitobacter koreensis TaxID=2968472 RepID=A0ABT1Z2V5_9RHOB|nr:thiamine pyrophosphate-binding protein [Pseudosulfitobacter koreense]MCR8827463.1 thiamine pyrophosphate-binding protein [Pseudosulfitobacter koreense]
MTKTIRAADAVAHRLYAAGCRMAFGMPGGEVLTMIDALEAAGITFVLCKHENAAAFMAEGAWHRTGAPGILVATVGPGVLNGVNAVANALQDRVPLIVLAGAVDADEAQSYTHQVLDQRAVFAPITKATFLLDAGATHTIIDKAVGITTEGQPGPVFIDIPIRVADAQVPVTAPTPRAVAAQVVPDADTLAQIAGWLSQAARPVIIAGVDALNEVADVAGLARQFGMPVITTYKAKGMLPEDDPLALGGAGLSPLADKTLLPFVQSADLVLCLGYDPIEMRPGWRDAWDSTTQRVVEVTAVPNHHYMHQSTINIVGSVSATVTALMQAATPRDTWSGSEVAAAKASLAAAFPADEDWGPAAIVATCRSALPRGTLATADSGAHRILLSQMWTCHEPRALMQSSALCTMGCAVPLAMGAALASPDRTVVSFSGDAGFLMVAGELATAKELGLRCIFVVFVDAALALIELKQRQRQLSNHGVDFGTHDFAAIGRAFGGEGVDVRSRAELDDALARAQAADTFSVIAAHIEKGAYDGRI